MLKDNIAFSGFSTDNIAKAKVFYEEILELEVEHDTQMDMLHLHLKPGYQVVVYPKPDHQPASFTVLNFIVDDIDTAVEQLHAKGVAFEHYDNLTDESGVARGLEVNRGPNIAWFKDPAGNILSLLQDK